MTRSSGLARALLPVALLLPSLCRAGQDRPTGADWELRALGVSDATELQALRDRVRRPVTLAIVGQGGVSKARLGPVLVEGNTLDYRMTPDGSEPDPGRETHDTSAARVILQLCLRLGVRVRLLVYHAGEPWSDVARGFAEAGREAPVVALYQSFWGNVTAMVESIEGAPEALFVSPYAEYQHRKTSTCLQAHALKPEGEGLANFVTVVPLARKAPGRLVQPAAGPSDTEVVNFVAPSYHASGAGGTCPAAEVAAAVALYAVAVSEVEPTPAALVELLRAASRVDRDALTSVPEFAPFHVDAVERQLERLRAGDGGARKLDAAGVLNLDALVEALDAAGGASAEPVEGE